MLEELNELEKIGLAFLSGVVAGCSLQEANQEIESKKDEKETNKKISLGKIEGEKAKEIIKIMEELGVE